MKDLKKIIHRRTLSDGRVIEGTRKGGNNYFMNQYSHHYARLHYPKHAPKDLKQQILKLMDDNTISISPERYAMHLRVLHKHVHKVFLELQIEGKIRMVRCVNFTRDENIDKQAKKHTLPPYYPSEAWHDSARLVNYWTRL